MIQIKISKIIIERMKNPPNIHPVNTFENAFLNPSLHNIQEFHLYLNDEILLNNRFEARY